MTTDKAIKILKGYVDDPGHVFRNLEMAVATLLLELLDSGESTVQEPSLRDAVMAIETEIDEHAERGHGKSAYVIGLHDAVKIIEKIRGE